MDSDKLRRIRDAVRLVHRRAREAAAAPTDRRAAYRLLENWSKRDAVLEDALTSVGLLLELKEALESRGELERATSLARLLSPDTEDDRP